MIKEDLLTAIKLAFPHYQTPKDIPNDKWKEIHIAYKVWEFIFYEKRLVFSLADTLLPVEKAQSYLNEIVGIILEGDP